jgi:integrase/recombinase XerD
VVQAQFKWLRTESPSQDELKDAVLRMREKGLRATGCNSAIRAINAYLKWSGSPLKIPQLKEPQLILPTFSLPQVTRLIESKPHSFYQRRLHLIVLILLDTGCRITEALTLRVGDVHFDNLLVVLDGKGRKQRKVPFSFELRKALFRYIREYDRKQDSLLLCSRSENKLGRRVVLRDVKLLCKRLGFDPPSRTLHAS